MAEQCCAVPKPRHAVLCPRCAGPCYAIAVRVRATPSLCFATHCPCASVLGRSVARRSHALEASPLPCAALPCPCRACPRRPTPSPRIAHQSCALASQTVALPKRGRSAQCLACALPCYAVALRSPSERGFALAPPGKAQPMRALCCALPPPCGPSGCLAVAKRAVAMPLLGRALKRPRKAMHGQRRVFLSRALPPLRVRDAQLAARRPLPLRAGGQRHRAVAPVHRASHGIATARLATARHPDGPQGGGRAQHSARKG